jgi:hypothetical protein
VNHFVADRALTDWMTKHNAVLRYRGRQEVREGDIVEVGSRTTAGNGDFPGVVLRWSFATGEVIVDERGSGVVRGHPVAALKLLARKQEEVEVTT